MAAVRLLLSLLLSLLLRVQLQVQAMRRGAVLPRPRARPPAACVRFPPA